MESLNGHLSGRLSAWFEAELFGKGIPDCSKDLFITPEEQRAANIERLKSVQNISLDGNAYQGKYELNKKSVHKYLKELRDELKNKPVRNKYISDDVHIGSTGMYKLISYGMNNDVYKKMFAHIPAFIQNAVFITDMKPNKANSKYEIYRHLVTGIELDGNLYTVHIVLGENAGVWYYDHMVSEIEKGDLLSVIHVTNAGHPASSLSEIKDITLFCILQASQQKNKEYPARNPGLRPAAVRTPSGSRVLTVIGSGGKTSLIWRLAQHLRGRRKNDGTIRKILVTTTTKMLVPPAPAQTGSSGGLYDHYCNGVPAENKNGVTLAGIFNEETGKLESLPLDELEQIVPDYDLVLIEGDGSRGLPLKAWAEHEPVVPLFTTMTVGILPLMSLGIPVSEAIVHRLPLFSTLCGAQEGDIIKPEHLVRVITGTPNARGLFAAAQGRKILFLNQVEDDKTLGQAGELVSLLPEDFRGGLWGIIAGSVKQDTVACF